MFPHDNGLTETANTDVPLHLLLGSSRGAGLVAATTLARCARDHLLLRWNALFHYDEIAKEDNQEWVLLPQFVAVMQVTAPAGSHPYANPHQVFFEVSL